MPCRFRNRGLSSSVQTEDVRLSADLGPGAESLTAAAETVLGTPPSPSKSQEDALSSGSVRARCFGRGALLGDDVEVRLDLEAVHRAPEAR